MPGRRCCRRERPLDAPYSACSLSSSSTNPPSVLELRVGRAPMAQTHRSSARSTFGEACGAGGRSPRPGGTRSARQTSSCYACSRAVRVESAARTVSPGLGMIDAAAERDAARPLGESARAAGSLARGPRRAACSHRLGPWAGARWKLLGTFAVTGHEHARSGIERLRRCGGVVVCTCTSGVVLRSWSAQDPFALDLVRL